MNTKICAAGVRLVRIKQQNKFSKLVYSLLRSILYRYTTIIYSDKEVIMRDFIENWVHSHQDLPIDSMWAPLLSDLWKESSKLYKESLASISMDSLVAAWLATAEGGHEVFTELGFSEESIRQMQTKLQSRAESLMPKDSAASLARLLAAASDRGAEPLDVLVQERTTTSSISSGIGNPTKQNPYEMVAESYLRMHLDPEVFPVVSLLGKTAINIRFTDRGVAEFGSKSSQRVSRTVDLVIVEKVAGKDPVVYLAAHKFARQAGGHQNAQLTEVSNYLNYARKWNQNGATQDVVTLLVNHGILESNRATITPIAILDGSFFKNKYVSEADGMIYGSTDDIIAHLSDRVSTPVVRKAPLVLKASRV